MSQHAGDEGALPAVVPESNGCAHEVATENGNAAGVAAAISAAEGTAKKKASKGRRPCLTLQSPLDGLPHCFTEEPCTEEPCTAGKKKVLEQTKPPTVPVADLFSSGVFPEGERQSYGEE